MFRGAKESVFSVLYTILEYPYVKCIHQLYNDTFSQCVFVYCVLCTARIIICAENLKDSNKKIR